MPVGTLPASSLLLYFIKGQLTRGCSIITPEMVKIVINYYFLSVYPVNIAATARFQKAMAPLI